MLEYIILIIPIILIIVGFYLFFNPNKQLSQYLRTFGLFGSNIRKRYGERKAISTFRLIAFWLIVTAILIFIVFLVVIHYIQTGSNYYTKIMVNYLPYVAILIVIISNISFRVLLNRK